MLSQLKFIEQLKTLSLEDLIWIEAQIAAERQRRDVCEHGVPDSEWCELCNREYKRSRAEYGLDSD